MQLHQLRTIYFLGIGGIGMSGLARYFAARGVKVSGYDKTQTELTLALEAEGIAVHYVDDPEWIPTDVDIVVYTPAIPADLQELNFVKQKQFPLLKRAEVLGLLSKNARCMAVAGTHGKTTTSSLLAHIMKVGQTDAVAFLGGIAYNYGTNYLPGTGDWFIAEADEYDRSFMQLHPEVACVMHLDPDHLDIYGTEEEMRQTYSRFVGQIKAGGSLFIRHGMPLALPTSLYETGVTVKTFGIEIGDIQGQNLHVEDDLFVFDYVAEALTLKGLRMPLPGKHNVENALAAISSALVAGVSGDQVREALATFKGVRRRFEVLFSSPQLLVVDDYAHHPTELQNAIAAARLMRPEAKITGIFQPHLFSRTKDFAQDFATELDKLDVPVLLEIYPARELPLAGVTATWLLSLMQNPNKRLMDKSELENLLETTSQGVLMILGAGDIENFRKPIVQYYQNQI